MIGRTAATARVLRFHCAWSPSSIGRLLFSTILLFAASAHSQMRTGPQVVTFFSTIDDTDQPYALYVPKMLSPAKRYPLIIALHGAGLNHRIFLRRVWGIANGPGESNEDATRTFPPLPDVDYVVATPLARGSMGYQSIAEQDVYDVLTDVKTRVPIDEDRVYLTGGSMGGGGSLWIGLTRPDVWAAIAALCPSPPDEVKTFAPNAANLPVHIFQGDADTVVTPEATRALVQLFKPYSGGVKYTEFPGVGHDVWTKAYEQARIFDFFANFKRNRFPDEVRFATDRYRYSSAYWVRIDGLTPGKPASIHARFIGRNKVEVKTNHVTGFTFSLKGHPKYSDAKPLEVILNGERAEASSLLAFSLREGKWANAALTRGERAKRAAAEGPIADALTSRHVYVFGTVGNNSPEESRAKREMAGRAAQWSNPIYPLMLALRVIPDFMVKPNDLAGSNLVLFGTKETNAIIAKIADKLPIALHPHAAPEYGLVYVYPYGSRYIVIASGLPWWTGAEALPPPSFQPLALPAYAATTVGDFMLFKHSIATPVVQGRFDENWRLPAEAAEKMKATGAVALTDR
jgi:poly(3-hydroxybutyrate) depolymerase